MKAPTFLALLFLPSIAIAGPQRMADFTRVVVASDALPVQKTAAAELAEYIGRVAGRKVELVGLEKFSGREAGLTFFVGDGAAERGLGKKVGDWGSEEYLLQTVPGGLVLAGEDGAGDPWSERTRAGSMLAVYTLLEDQLGVHWFWPGPFGEHVPRAAAEATLPELAVRRAPAWEIRSIQLGYAASYTKQFYEDARRWARRNRQGWVRSAYFGHSWDSTFKFTKGGDTLREHPDWFALVNGKRQPPQMCTTNPEVIEKVVEHVLHGASVIESISPSDGGGFCECERCRALDVPGVLAYDHVHVQLSDRIFTYANEVARRVRERDPTRGCGMFAYTYYNRPPLHIAKLEPNLYLSFVYQSAAQRDPDNLREWRENVAGWQRLGAKMVVREGWGNHYYFDLPFLHPRQIITNLAEAQQLGFTGAYGDGSKCFATVAPNYWALTHMMWDPARDTSHLMRDFYEAAYGPVANEMQAYFETYEHALDANWAKRDRVVDTNAIAYANMVGSWGKLLPPAAVEEAERHLRAAEAKAPAGEYADRLQLHRAGQDETRVWLELLETYRQLAAHGVDVGFTSVEQAPPATPAERETMLRRAYTLGERHEANLLAHRNWAGPNEGLYAYMNERHVRQWHAAVKKALGIDQPSAVTNATLAAGGKGR